MNNLSIIIIICFVFLVPSASKKHPYKTKQIIDYDLSFSEKSDVTLVLTSCAQYQNLKETIRSFFYYNTYPLKQVLLQDYCSGDKERLLNCFPTNASAHTNLIQIFTQKSSQMHAYEIIYKKVKTKYIINIPSKWITYQGFGHYQSAVELFKYAQENDIKISQITTLYPQWGEYRYLGQMKTTKNGINFHQIHTFKPAERYYFTFNPSIINFEYLYKTILKESLRDFAGRNSCDSSDRECMQKAIGKQLYETNKYFQAFINDGGVDTNIFLNE